VFSGLARGSGYRLNDRWNETVGILQAENAIRVVGPGHPAHGFMEGAYFRDYSTSWTISVDFRSDPGAGMTASIQFKKNGNGVIPNTTGYDSFRTEDMPRKEASLFNFFNLSSLSPEELEALRKEALNQWGQGDVRYLEILVAAEAEQRRREEEERKRREQEACGSPGKCAPPKAD
jgi:hypothetical protein